MLSQPEKSLRFKVWAGVFITLIIAATAIGGSYKSFKRLTGSIDQLSEPNHKLTLINHILREFISAENNVQRYIITGNVKSARTYESQVDEIRLKILELKEWIKSDSSQLGRVDSLEVIFQKKLDYLNRFLVLKKKRQATLFTKMAMDQIEMSTRDTTAIKNNIGLGQTYEAKSQSVDSAYGFWQELRLLLAAELTPYDTANWPKEDYLSYLSDPGQIAAYTQLDRDTLLARVKSILAQTEGIELQMQQSLTQREYALLKQGSVFMTEIQSIIENLEMNERIMAQARQTEASAIATNSTLKIAFIGIGGLLVTVLLLIMISRDITKAAFFRRQLEQAKEKAEQFGKMKESFLANMSHEIRTPLNSILGFTRLLKRTRLSSDQEVYMNAVDSSSTYLTELVDDILDYSKMDSGKLELVNESFNTKRLARDIERMFRLTAENKQLDFHVVISDSVPERLNGDAFRLKQIITNLLSNALKFTDQGQVYLDIKGNWFKDVFYMGVSVKDTGIGIDPNKLEVIFESFTQEEASTADSFGGTGLGLSICKQLAEAMNGSIDVKSEKEKGTTFIVKLPFEKAGEDNTVVLEELPENELFYDASVVLVDDDHWNVLLLETLLKRKVKRVKAFLSADEALLYIRKQEGEVHMIFTDLKMPGMSGQTFAKACRSIVSKVPLIAVTAHLRVDKSQQLKDFGINAVCPKPFTEERIDELLAAFLDEFKTDECDVICESVTAKGGGIIDLTSLNAFAGNDLVVLEGFLSEFIENNRNQIAEFSKLKMEKNWSGLAELAHKMSPSYKQLKVYQISELMQSIELYAEIENFKRVEEISEETLQAIHTCFDCLTNLKAQDHIA